MRQLELLVPALFLLWVLPVGAQPVGDAAAREGLLKTDKEWAQVAATRELERILSYWMDDAVIYSPGEAPVAGKPAIRQYVGESLKMPAFSITWTPMQAEVSRSGDLGYTTGTNAVTIPAAQGGSTTMTGRYVTIWKKASDGKWRCVVDSWSPAPPPAAPSPK